MPKLNTDKLVTVTDRALAFPPDRAKYRNVKGRVIGCAEGDPDFVMVKWGGPLDCASMWRRDELRNCTSAEMARIIRDSP